MKVWFAASEAGPLAKSGGLADVVGSLPKALAARGIDVTVVLPKYDAIPDDIARSARLLHRFDVSVGWRLPYCGLLETQVDGIRYLLVDNEHYFKRGYLYGYGEEEAERYAFFSFAVLETLVRCQREELPDILHCHDWQTGLVPLLLRTRYSHVSALRGIRTVFTIHNLGYQGVFSRGKLQDVLGAGDELFSPQGIEFYGDGSCLKAGLRYADKLTTVSPTYAREIQTPEYGEKLDGLLRERAGDLKGILNGIDVASYDPETDPHLAVRYRDSLSRKRLNKTALQLEFGLPENEGAPLIGIVSRLVRQKGFELIGEALPGLMAENVQLFVLGAGEPRVEAMLRDALERYPGQLRIWFGFNEGLARRVYAASDLFLMPSLFEPCGLSQLISLRYRSVPVVRETGGLKDTVQAYNEYTGTGNGFSFGPATAHDLLFTVRRALAFYRDEAVWERIVANGVARDYGWDSSAREYEELYQGLVRKGRGLG